MDSCCPLFYLTPELDQQVKEQWYYKHLQTVLWKTNQDMPLQSGQQSGEFLKIACSVGVSLCPYHMHNIP